MSTTGQIENDNDVGLNVVPADLCRSILSYTNSSDDNNNNNNSTVMTTFDFNLIPPPTKKKKKKNMSVNDRNDEIRVS